MSEAPTGAVAAREPLSPAALGCLLLAALLIFVGLAALGTWQIERRAWKLDLIERIRQRVHAEPVAPPVLAEWSNVSAARDEYRRVRVAGTFLHELETRVQASTVLGVGHWVLTPLRSSDGSVVLVNRGFVAGDGRDRALPSEPSSPTTVTGLLRVTEPGGGFLRRNDPAAGRWHSRDVQAIAAARGLSGVAPFFVDADGPSGSAAGSARGAPIGGLTVIDFPNNHLVYALTWYTLALMVAAAAAWIGVEEMRAARRTGDRAAQDDQCVGRVRAEHSSDSA